MAISGNFTYSSSFKNQDVNKKSAQEYDDSGISKEAESLSDSSQEDVLSVFLDNFSDYTFNTVGETGYFSKTDENDNKECVRVVNDNGEYKIIYTTIEKGSTEGETQIYSITQADKFNQWTNSEDNYDNAINKGIDVEDFEMFDFNASTYSSDLKGFSQQYIDKYDENGDGVWNLDEFINMSSDGIDISDMLSDDIEISAEQKEELKEELKEEYKKMLKESFNTLNLDDNNTIDAGEFASMLYYTDSHGDINNKDGKINYNDYNTYSGMTEELDYDTYSDMQNDRIDFYKDNYGN